MLDKSQLGREKVLNMPALLFWGIMPGNWVIVSRHRSDLSFKGPEVQEASRHFGNRLCFNISTFEDEATRLLQNVGNVLPIDAASCFRRTNPELRSFENLTSGKKKSY